MSIPDAKDRKYGLEGFKLLKKLPVIRGYMAKDGASEHWNEMHIIGYGLTIIAYETDDSERVTHAYFVRRINSDYEITELKNIAIGVELHFISKIICIHIITNSYLFSKCYPYPHAI